MSVARPARVFVVRVAYTKVFLSGLLEGLTFEETEGASSLQALQALEASGRSVKPCAGGSHYRVRDVRLVELAEVVR